MGSACERPRGRPIEIQGTIDERESTNQSINIEVALLLSGKSVRAVALYTSLQNLPTKSYFIQGTTESVPQLGQTVSSKRLKMEKVFNIKLSGTE